MPALHLLTVEDLDRHTLAETALEASGGGVITSLAPATPDAEVWRASVIGTDGIVRAVRLDLRLRTVAVAELHPARAVA
jgi:hypothetical protein